VVLQRAASGQWRAIKEIVPGRLSARRFAEKVKQVLSEIAPGEKVLSAFADPAGFDGADKEDGELAWAETVAMKLKTRIYPAPCNEIDLRLAAVKDELTFMIDGSTPALMICAVGCPMLRKGFASEYKFKRQRVGNTDQFSDKPMKNDFSNPHDGLQYIFLGVKGRFGVIKGERGLVRSGSRKNTKLKTGFSVFGSTQ